jgi:hypothetical protein
MEDKKENVACKEQGEWAEVPPYPSELEVLKTQNKLLREQVEKFKQEKADASRKYLPTLGELLDRLTIVQIKEVKIPEHKKEYAEEIAAILHDIDQILSRGEIYFTADMLRSLIVLAQMNLHIWHNETNFRRGIKDGNNLELTHGLNGIRNTAKNLIQNVIGGRKDYKIDCLAADFKDWEVSWNGTTTK